jgi:hypothetical protein
LEDGVKEQREKIFWDKMRPERLARIDKSEVNPGIKEELLTF